MNNRRLYLGVVGLEETLTIPLQVETDAHAPVAADGTISYRIYGPDPTTTMSNGTGTFSGPIDSQTGFYKATHSITSASGYASGQNYTIRITYAVSSVTKVQVYQFTVT